MEDQRRAEAEQDAAVPADVEHELEGELLVFKKRLEDANKALDIQKQDGNWDYDPYMHGMLNGMEYVLATVEGRECDFCDAPLKWRTKDLTEFVEDLAKNGTRFDLKPRMQTKTIDDVVYYQADGAESYIGNIDDSIRVRAMDALTFEPREDMPVVAPEIVEHKTFENELAHLINRYGIDADMDVSDFVLATFINEFLVTFARTIKLREVGHYIKGPTIHSISIADAEHADPHTSIEMVPADNSGCEGTGELIMTPIPDDATDEQIDAAFAEHNAKMQAAEVHEIVADGKVYFKGTAADLIRMAIPDMPETYEGGLVWSPGDTPEHIANVNATFGADTDETYICSECGGEFAKEIGDEEAWADSKRLFGDALTLENASIVCDACFKKIKELYPLADEEPV